MNLTHTLTLGRCQLGRANIRGAGMRYGSTGRCSCGDWKIQVNIAPSKGGHPRVKQLFAAHVDMLTETDTQGQPS